MASAGRPPRPRSATVTRGSSTPPAPGGGAAETLLGDGHQVIVHTRGAGRLAAVEPLISRGASAVLGDLADLDETRAVAAQVNRLGPLDAVIHNAGVTRGPQI